VPNRTPLVVMAPLPLCLAGVAVALLISALAPPSLARAQDGVFVDPDSPAGKEYALPLEQARREAAGGANRGEGEASGGREPSLFGEGINPGNGAAGDRDRGPVGALRGGVSGRADADQDGSARSGERQGTSEAPGAADLAPDARSSAALEAAASEGSDVLVTVGIASAVLGVGLLAGFGLRRLMRDS
jgi:hypothetical protein